MQLRIDKSVLDQFPGVVLGVLVCQGVDNSKTEVEVQQLLLEAQTQVRAKFSLESLAMLPEINMWRKTYQAFGAKPKEHRSSIENLMRLVLQGKELHQINTLVDIYNVISLKYLLPAGGEDLDKMIGDLRLTIAKGDEPPALLLGDKEPRSAHAGEVIYRDDVGIICRRWNWREADRTKLTQSTKKAVLVLEGLPPVSNEEIQTATQELAHLIIRHCGGEVTVHLLDQNNPSCALS